MIIDKLAASARIRVEQSKITIPLERVIEKAKSIPVNPSFSFEKAVAGQPISFICEVKKASPSKGIIAEHFPYLDIAREYEEAGAAAISVLTEPEYFKGSDCYLTEIAATVTIPVLRKDFTIDPYQIYEARVLGASAVLLICSLLDTDTIREYIAICDQLGMSALVEAYDESEVERALAAGARLIGVNNRNLKTFTVDITNCTRLRKMVPENIPYVAESGIRTAEDINVLREAGVNAVLIGETLMRSPDKKKELELLRGGRS